MSHKQTAEYSGARCRQLWNSSRSNRESGSKSLEGKRSGRVEPNAHGSHQAGMIEDGGGSGGKKTSLAVPVVASYMIISGEEAGSEHMSEPEPSIRGRGRAEQGTHGSSYAGRQEGAFGAAGQEGCASNAGAMRYKQENEDQRSREEQKSSFQCKVCERHFDTAARLKSHRAANACHAPYACRLCSREFHRANELAEHAEAAHADPRMCVLCGRLLSRKDKLENHVRTHTGEQPFECKFCLKRFSRRDRFNEHEKLHRGVSFKCAECQKCFSRRDKMKEHLQRSHHDRSEECDWYGGTVR